MNSILTEYVKKNSINNTKCYIESKMVTAKAMKYKEYIEFKDSMKMQQPSLEEDGYLIDFDDNFYWVDKVEFEQFYLPYDALESGRIKCCLKPTTEIIEHYILDECFEWATDKTAVLSCELANGLSISESYSIWELGGEEIDPFDIYTLCKDKIVDKLNYLLTFHLYTALMGHIFE